MVGLGAGDISGGVDVPAGMNVSGAGNGAGCGQVSQSSVAAVLAAAVNEISATEKIDSPGECAAALGHEIQINVSAFVRLAAVDGLDHSGEVFELFLDPILDLLIKRPVCVRVLVMILQVFLRGQNEGLVQDSRDLGGIADDNRNRDTLLNRCGRRGRDKLGGVVCVLIAIENIF